MSVEFGLGLLALSGVAFGTGRLMVPSDRFSSTCSASVFAIGVMLLLAAVKIGTTSSLARSVLPEPRLAAVDLGRMTPVMDGRASVEARIVHNAGLAVVPGAAEAVRQVQARLDAQRAGARPARIRIDLRLSHAHQHGLADGMLGALDYDSAALLGAGGSASDAELLALGKEARLNASYPAGLKLLREECGAAPAEIARVPLCRSASTRR